MKKINFWNFYILNIIMVHHLKLEIESAIPAENERKIYLNASVAFRVKGVRSRGIRSPAYSGLTYLFHPPKFEDGMRIKNIIGFVINKSDK